MTDHQVDETGAAREREKRRRIYHAAEPIFARFGYRKTTVEEVCSAAGISKRTFYQLFQNKGDLFAHLLVSRTENAVREWIRQLEPGLTPSQKLLSFIELYADLMITRPLIRLLYESPEATEAFRGFDYDFTASPTILFLRSIIDEGMASGEFRRVDTHSALLIILAVIRSMYVLMPIHASTPGAAEDAVLEHETLQFILHGLRACPHDQSTQVGGQNI